MPSARLSGKIAARVFNFARGEGDVVPRVCAEEGADLHDGDDGEQADECGWAADADLYRVGGVPTRTRPEVVPIGSEVGGDGCGVFGDETDENDGGEGEDFCGGEDVLHRSAKFDAEGVEQREQGDDDDGGEVRGVEADVHVAEDHGADGNRRHMRDVPEPVLRADGREEDSEEFAEGDADRGDGAGLNDKEERPAVEEAAERAEGLAEIDVLTAGLGHHGRQFAVAERADEGHQRRNQPGGNEKCGRADGATHICGDDEDAGADHGAHDDGRGGEEAHAAHKMRGWERINLMDAG